MRAEHRSWFDMLVRACAFITAHLQRFAETSSARSACSIVAKEVAQIEALAVAEHVSSRSGRMARKQEVRQQLVGALARAANTAWVLSRTIPELAEHAESPVKMRMPDRQLLTFGRGFVAAATPHAAQFAAHDITIESLTQHIEAFEGVVAESAARRDELKQTRSLLNESLKRALQAVDTLDVTVANTFSSDAAMLAAWKQARRLEKPRQRPRGVRPAAATSVMSAPVVSSAPLPVSPDAVAPAAAQETVMPEVPVVTNVTPIKAA